VDSFTRLPLYPRGKSPRFPLDRRLGGPQSQSGRHGENAWPYRDSNSDPSFIQPVASRYTDWAIPAPLQLYKFTNLKEPRREWRGKKEVKKGRKYERHVKKRNEEIDRQKKGKVVLMLNWLGTETWRCMGRCGYSYTIPVVNFTLPPVYPRENSPCTRCIGGWVGPRAGLEAVEYRNILCPYRDSNSTWSARSPSLCNQSYYYFLLLVGWD
jgi:hypothetical protein